MILLTKAKVLLVNILMQIKRFMGKEILDKHVFCLGLIYVCNGNVSGAFRFTWDY